jgi:DNA-binding response OmpR family regulator
VICTDTAAQALSLAKAQPFDLYLIDSWLPNSSGAMLTKKLREFDAKTPILFYSGAAYEADKENARDAGAQAYLVKPAENEKLVAEVSRLIGESNIEKPTRVV